MLLGIKKNSAVLALFILLFSFSAQSWSQALFTTPGKFKVTSACQAFTSFRNNTGAVNLEINKIYDAFGENKASGGSHAQISVDGQRKWVSVGCGEYEGGKPPFRNQSGGTNQPTGGNAECLPFFDNENNLVTVGVGGDVDITPQPPQIEPFGAALNQVCGASGKVTTRAEFKQLLNDHPSVLADLMAYTGGKVFNSRSAHQDQASYLEDLAEAWYEISAFDHIFCGEPTGANKIGGLHYHGRYQQLQASGEACRLPNFNQNEVVPGSIYTMGVRMKRANGAWAQFSRKGYGLTLSAVETLKVITRAFAENPTSSNNSTGCILEVKDSDTRYDTVFVRRAKGIRTFFPDATPDFGRNPACANPIILSQSDTDPVVTTNCDDVSDDSQSLSAGKFRIRVASFDDKGFNLRVDECE